MPRKKKEIQEPILHDLVHRGETPEVIPVPTEVQEPTTVTLENKLDLQNVENITEDSVTIDGIKVTKEDIANSKKTPSEGVKFPDILEKKELMITRLNEAKTDANITPEELSKLEEAELSINLAFDMSFPAKNNFIQNKDSNRITRPSEVEKFEKKVFKELITLHKRAFFPLNNIKQAIFDALDKECTKTEITLFYINYLQFIYNNRKKYDLINTSLFLFHKLSVGRLSKVSVGSIISESNRAFFAEQRDLIIKEIKTAKIR
jgi:hypothetical protein